LNTEIITISQFTMENISMPADHEKVLFTDQNGTRHEGVYRKVLKAFVDTENGKDPEDINNIYLEDKIVDWKYVHKDTSLDSDIMVIL